MRLVVLESPLAGDYEANIAYAKRCLRDSLLRGESPMASHLLYAQDGVLDDTNPESRTIGMEAGFAWLHAADASVVYTDRGISPGMAKGIELAELLSVPIEYRTLEDPG